VLRKRLTTALEIAGFALITAGFWVLSTVAGLIAAGVALITLGVLNA
jgi:hypothetical protein